MHLRSRWKSHGGVTRQYCGPLGKQDDGQAAVTLSLASERASLPIAHRLYLPQPWADDPARRARAGVPDDVAFQTKPHIALAQFRAALEAGVPPATVLADAGYGIDTAFRDAITAYDALFNPLTCIYRRSELKAAKKQAILAELQAAGLYSNADAAAFPGGALAGVFPPVVDDKV